MENFLSENLQSFPPGMVIFIEYQASETGFWTQQGLTRTSVIPLGGAGVNEAFQVSKEKFNCPFYYKIVKRRRS